MDTHFYTLRGVWHSSVIIICRTWEFNLKSRRTKHRTQCVKNENQKSVNRRREDEWSSWRALEQGLAPVVFCTNLRPPILKDTKLFQDKLATYIEGFRVETLTTGFLSLSLVRAGNLIRHALIIMRISLIRTGKINLVRIRRIFLDRMWKIIT